MNLESYRITKGNQLIEAKYRLSVVEQRLVLHVISNVEPHDEDFKIYNVDLQKIKNLLNIEEYDQVRNLLKSINSKPVVIKQGEKDLILNWIQDISMDSDNISFRISENLKPYLLSLKDRFTSYKFSNIVKLKSTYAIRLYELLKQYEKIGYREFQIEELKSILGIEPNEYVLFGDFNRFVLQKSETELLKTDIRVKYDPKKLKRKVVSIAFSIEPNFPNEEPNLFNQLTDVMVSSEIEEFLLNLNFTKREIKNLFNTGYDIVDNEVKERVRNYKISFDEYIEQKINLVKKQKGIFNSQGYLKSAIKFDYQDTVIKKTDEAKVRKKQKISIDEENKKLKVQYSSLVMRKEDDIANLIIKISEEKKEFLSELMKNSVPQKDKNELNDPLNVFKQNIRLRAYALDYFQKNFSDIYKDEFENISNKYEHEFNEVLYKIKKLNLS